MSQGFSIQHGPDPVTWFDSRFYFLKHNIMTPWKYMIRWTRRGRRCSGWRTWSSGRRDVVAGHGSLQTISIQVNAEGHSKNNWLHVYNKKVHMVEICHRCNGRWDTCNSTTVSKIMIRVDKMGDSKRKTGDTSANMHHWHHIYTYR